MSDAAKQFHEYLLHDVFAEYEGVTTKPMFGGYGLYKNGVIFGIIIDDDVFALKAKDELADWYATQGSAQFVYTGHTSKKPTHMPYWSVPDMVLEDRDQCADWVSRCFDYVMKK